MDVASMKPSFAKLPSTDEYATVLSEVGSLKHLTLNMLNGAFTLKLTYVDLGVKVTVLHDVLKLPLGPPPPPHKRAQNDEC